MKTVRRGSTALITRRILASNASTDCVPACVAGASGSFRISYPTTFGSASKRRDHHRREPRVEAQCDRVGVEVGERPDLAAGGGRVFALADPGVKPGRDAASARGEVRRPVVLVQIDQHVDVVSLIPGDLLLDAGEEGGVPARIGCRRGGRLQIGPADVDPDEVRAELDDARLQRRVGPGRDVHTPQDDRGTRTGVDEPVPGGRHPGRRLGGCRRHAAQADRGDQAGADQVLPDVHRPEGRS